MIRVPGIVDYPVFSSNSDIQLLGRTNAPKWSHCTAPKNCSSPSWSRPVLIRSILRSLIWTEWFNFQTHTINARAKSTTATTRMITSATIIGTSSENSPITGHPSVKSPLRASVKPPYILCSTLPTSVRQKWKTTSALTLGYSRTIGGMLLTFAARKVGWNTLIHRVCLIVKITLYIIDSFEAVGVSIR